MASAEEFTRTIKQNDILTLLREWQEVVFYTVFVKKREGLEVPMLLPWGERHAFLGSPDHEQVQSGLAQYEIPTDADVFIKPVALKELARNAFLLGAWLAWVGEELVMNDSLMCFLGMKAIGRNQRGEERLYESQVLDLQSTGKDGSSKLLKAQKWHVSPIEGEAVSRNSTVTLVFDGILLGSDFKQLSGAKAVSELTSKEQALFSHWNQPVYDFAGVASLSEDETQLEDAYSALPTVIDSEILESFFDLERSVHNQLMRDDRSIRLEVRSRQALANGDSNIEWIEGRGYTVLFEGRENWLLFLGGSGLTLEELTGQTILPWDIGVYPMPSDLRLRLIRHIAWVLFWFGRDPLKPFHLVPGQFWAQHPFYPDNTNSLFVPDYSDHRFPVLASMTCGSDRVPVLIHGEMLEGYVCEPLEKIDIKASDLPAGIQVKDSLLVNGMVSFPDMCSSLVVPVTAIEFPAEWYWGTRTSNSQLISDFRQFLELSAVDRQRSDKKQDVDGSRQVAKLGKGLLVSFAAAFALVLVLILISELSH
ncbi:hypothetical protein [Marinobacter mobilis]|uniref:hypothetical protein n=1 Tax=Marinobacter mobilis TaxID=488533 RepID=UPI0035C7574E